jgi:hypothetical protein
MNKDLWLGAASATLAAAVVGGALVAVPMMVRHTENRAETRTTNTGGLSPGSGGTSAATAPARWASSTQFMEIRSGQVRNGAVQLEVRPAGKKPLGESFETVPIPGPFSTVTLVEHARILHMDGESGSPEVLVDDLAKRSDRQEGFTLHFDRAGRVTEVDWEYVPAAPAKPAPAKPKPKAQAAKWAGTTQFMEVKTGSARKDGTFTLVVRPAKKEILGESFRTVPTGGPYTNVVMIGQARILHLDGESGIPQVFLETLARRSPNRPGYVTPDERQEGFDVTFDRQGRVTQVEWLYVPQF